MRQGLIVFALLIIGVFVVVMAIDKQTRDRLFAWVTGKTEEIKGELTGKTPAKTPDEAIDKFRSALEEGDYEWAAKCCTGPYAEQMRGSAASAKEIRMAIDGLLGMMEQKKIQSDKIRPFLKSGAFVYPFPDTLDKVKIESKGEAKAVASVRWNGAPRQLELTREGEVWKINIPENPPINHELIDKLRKNHKDLANAITKIKTELLNDATVQSDVESALKTELGKVGK